MVMKKLYILLLLSLMFASGIVYTMERDIPKEGKQEVEGMIIESDSNIEQFDLLSFLEILPAEIRTLIISYIINVDDVEQVYKNISSLLKTSKEAYALFQDDAFVQTLVNYLYDKFILPAAQFVIQDKTATQLSDYSKVFDSALTLAISLENNSYAIDRLKQLLADLGDEQYQKPFLTFFMWNKIENGSLKKVAFLVENIDKNLVNFVDEEYGITTLMIATLAGNATIAKYLIDNGAQVNAATKDGFTALIYAARDGNLEIVNYLVGQGAQVNVTNTLGNTARDKAQANGHQQIVAILDEAAQKQSKEE